MQVDAADSAGKESGREDSATLKGWIRDWVELEIYLLSVIIVTISSSEKKGEELRYAYSLLPYSVERSRTKIMELLRNYELGIQLDHESRRRFGGYFFSTIGRLCKMMFSMIYVAIMTASDRE